MVPTRKMIDDQLELIRARRIQARMFARRYDSADGDDIEWITANGTHIPLVNGKAVGGPLKGADFSKANSHGSEPGGSGRDAEDLRNVKKLLEKQRGKKVWEVPADERKSVLKAIKDANMYLKSNPDDLYDTVVAMSENMSYRENAEMNIALNGYNPLDIDDYVSYCKKKGTEPKTHEEPKEIDSSSFYSKSGKLLHDGTPVYDGLDKHRCLSDSELNQFSGLDDARDPEGSKKIKKATEDACGSWSDNERRAVNQYSKQYSPTNYVAVNKFLATGEGSDEVKKAAEDIDSALNHPIGSDCVTFRGQSDLTGIVDNQKLEKIVKQIEKGNFSNAAALKSGLEGATVTNAAVMSTSKFESSTGYGYRPVQMLFKTPSTAKAVDITNASAYGGSQDRATKALLNTGFFGYASKENEVAYKPGTSYRIDKVMFSRAIDDRKGKFYGKVYLVCSVIAE